MKVIKSSRGGIGYLTAILKDKKTVSTSAALWRIPHATKPEEVNLKIGRYKKEAGFETLEFRDPKSELTLDSEEFAALIEFISENYEPFKDGVKKYIPLDDFDDRNVVHVRALFENPDKAALLSFISENNILPEDLLVDLEHQKRMQAVKEFEQMLNEDLLEDKWQSWFQENQWVLGTEFVKVLDEREIDTAHITDYLMQAYDGFLDIVEIKRPEGSLRFWAASQDHGNYFPSSDLVKAITQATRYILEVEREANSIKFLERVGNIKTVKPRCVLVFGRSNDWNSEQKEAYRVLNSSYHNVSITTYDHVLSRAKRILGMEDQIVSKTSPQEAKEEIDPDDIPF